MKYTKLFYGNQHIKDLDLTGKGWKARLSRSFKKWLMRSAKTCLIAWAMVGSMLIGQYRASATIVYADKEVIKEVELSAPVMQRIAKCESTNTQLRNGQTLIHVNTDGTYDQGKFQINSIWNKKATELKYNLAVEADNEAFAMYLYKNVGTSPWYSSAKCWQ